MNTGLASPLAGPGTNLTGRTWDAVVVGAGPAGAVAARRLALGGATVLLVDRARFPRAKVCGCCLSPRALSALRAEGLEAAVERAGMAPLDGLELWAPGGTARVPLRGAATLSREALDATLADEAVAAGATFVQERRAELRPLAEDASRSPSDASARELLLHGVGGDDAPLRVAARLVLAADGLAGRLLDGEAGGPPRVSRRARLGAGCLLPTADGPGAPPPGSVRLAIGRRGYVGLVALPDGRLDVAAAFDAEWLRARGGAGPAAVQVLAEARLPAPQGLMDAPWRGTPPLTRRRHPLAAARALALGDAAGYVEPFTGEGLGWAIGAGAGAARLALDWLAFEGLSPADHSDLERTWNRTWQREVGRRTWGCSAIAAILRRPWLVHPLVRLGRARPALLSRLAWRLQSGGAR